VKIYLAGKIAPRDWREAIVTNLHLPDVVSCPQADGDPFARDEWPVLPKAIFQTHDYVGPFFANCGHGCFYGDDSHGLGARLLQVAAWPRESHVNRLLRTGYSEM
jgi:hypothetical protein